MVSVAPSPSSSRGEVVLQPAYFTSSTFVHAARADIDGLLQQYSQQYADSRHRPFGLFKDIWQAQGWLWIQFKVFDARTRATFLRVMMRLFLERIGDGGTPLKRIAALFGLYTLFLTQPTTSAPPLYSVGQVEVAYDVYAALMMLPNALDEEFLFPVRPHVVYVQSELLQAQVFLIVPRAEMRPLNPRALPREVVDKEAPTKKRGRPSRRDKAKKAKEALAALDGWRSGVVPPEGTVYAGAKTRLASAEGALRAASGAVVERILSINLEQ